MTWQSFYIDGLKLGFSEELAARYADYKMNQTFTK
jgi:hypothetical protein